MSWHDPGLYFFLCLLTGFATFLAIIYECIKKFGRKPPLVLKKAKPLDGLQRDRPARTEERASKRPSGSVSFARASRTSRRRNKQAGCVNISESSEERAPHSAEVKGLGAVRRNLLSRTCAHKITTGGSDLINVRFAPLCGLKSDMPLWPRSAISGCEQVQQTERLFDYLVGASEQGEWNGETERSRRF
jgi:hypothetical protein